MAEPPDLAELAKRYVDLWQDHLTAIAGDPALADGMARLFLGAAPRPAGGSTDGERRASPPGTAAAAAPSPERDKRVAGLARRLAAAEKRLAALEARLRVKGAGTARKAQRRRR
jgi:hypothetical protein